MPESPERGARYRAPESRARALYRVPAAPGAESTLVLFHRHPPLWTPSSADAENVTLCGIGPKMAAGIPEQSPQASVQWHAEYRNPLPFPDGAFDRVVLHRTLDELAATARDHKARLEAAPLLEQISRVLKPGGIVAGCVDNRFGYRSLLRQAKQRFRGTADPVAPGHFTARTLSQAVKTARLTNAHIYILLPDCHEPLRLVDSDPGVTKTVFRHELLAARQLWSKPGYLFRRLAVEMGIYTRFEESMFFWARKQC